MKNALVLTKLRSGAAITPLLRVTCRAKTFGLGAMTTIEGNT